MSLIMRLWHRYVLRHEQSQKEVTARMLYDSKRRTLIRCECGEVWST